MRGREQEPRRKAGPPALWIFLTVQNYGRTPARIKRIAGILNLLPLDQSLPDDPEYITGQGFDEVIDAVLPPDLPIQPRLNITGQEFALVLQGTRTLYAHGFIEYLDVGGNCRRTAHCLVYVIQAGFSPTQTGFYPAFNVPRAYTECT